MEKRPFLLELNLRVLAVSIFLFLLPLFKTGAEEQVAVVQEEAGTRVTFLNRMELLDDKKMALIIGAVSFSSEGGSASVEERNDTSQKIEIDDIFDAISSGKTVHIMVEDLVIRTVSGGASWKDDDGTGGSQPGVFTAFSHIEDILKVDMLKAMEIEPKKGVISGLNTGVVAYLEQRIPGMIIQIEKMTKILGLKDRMVTEGHEFYKYGDINPYTGHLISIDDQDMLINGGSPKIKYLRNNEILASYHAAGKIIMTSGEITNQGVPDLSSPARVYVFLH